jgi:hypothetical protein
LVLLVEVMEAVVVGEELILAHFLLQVSRFQILHT